MTPNSRVRTYFQTQFSGFDRALLISTDGIVAGLRTVGGLWLFAIPIVWVTWRFSNFVPVQYLTQAIAQGIGPQLWNILGAVGLELFGLAFLFPTTRWLARTTHAVLSNTYSIGALGLGFLLGQIFVIGATAQQPAEDWRGLFQYSLLLLLFLDALILNFVVWYLAMLAASEVYGTTFLPRLSQLHLRIRLPMAALFMGLPILFLAMEK